MPIKKNRKNLERQLSAMGLAECFLKIIYISYVVCYIGVKAQKIKTRAE